MNEVIKQVTCYYCGKAVLYKDCHIARGFVSHKHCPKREKREREIVLEILREYKNAEVEFINPCSIYTKIRATMLKYGIIFIYAKDLHKLAWTKYRVRIGL